MAELTKSEQQISSSPFVDKKKKEFMWLDRSLFNFKTQLLSHLETNYEGSFFFLFLFFSIIHSSVHY